MFLGGKVTTGTARAQAIPYSDLIDLARCFAFRGTNVHRVLRQANKPTSQASRYMCVIACIFAYGIYVAVIPFDWNEYIKLYKRYEVCHI